MGMMRLVIRRLIIIPLLLVVLSFFVFLCLHLAPGDPARRLAGPRATENEVELIRIANGLDKPVYVQYLRWLIGWPGPEENIPLENVFIPGGVLRGDLGRSMVTHEPISKEILNRLPVTLEVTVLALLIATVVGLFLGIIAALKRGTIVDYLSTTGSLFGLSMPSFWLGLMMILVLSYKLGWIAPAYDGSFTYLIWPAIALGAYHTASVARMTRSSMLEVLGQDYIRTARVKGLPERVVIWKHGLRNALIPIVTILLLQIPWLFGGTVILEYIFAVPGMGRFMFTSIIARDYFVVQGIFLVFVVLTIFANLLADILYAYVNPKVRYE